MNNTAIETNLDSSLSKLNMEAKINYSNIYNDFKAGRKINIKNIEIFTCESVREIFDLKTCYRLFFTVDWTNKTILTMNDGLFGLILDELNNNNIFSEIVFNRFFYLLDKFLEKNDIIKQDLSKRSLEEINRKYNKNYESSEVRGLSALFSQDVNKNYIMELRLDLFVNRKK